MIGAVGTRHNVESSASTADNNVVRDNCLWSDRGGYHGGEPAGSGIAPERPGIKLGPNTIADPRFVDRRDFRFRAPAARLSPSRPG